MLRGEFTDASQRTPEELRSAYESVLAAVVGDVGVDSVADETDLDQETVEAVLAQESPTVTVEEAAAILSLDEDQPGGDVIEADARDILLMGMTTAVLDVEALSSGIDGALEPKEIQQKVEGRYPMTLAEYATLHQHIEQRKI